jgi:hypothetical protein
MLIKNQLMELLWSITSSGKYSGTAYYFRNLLNCRNIKGYVKNSYRAYKMLYYTIFDGICCALFLRELNLKSFDDDIPLPPDWDKLCDSVTYPFMFRQLSKFLK